MRSSLRKGTGGRAFASAAFCSEGSVCVWAFFSSSECHGGAPSCQLNGARNLPISPYASVCVVPECGGRGYTSRWAESSPAPLQRIPKGTHRVSHPDFFRVVSAHVPPRPYVHECPQSIDPIYSDSRKFRISQMLQMVIEIPPRFGAS